MGLCLFLSLSVVMSKIGLPAAWAQDAATSAAPVPKEACLKCHGPFEKLTGAPAGFAAPSGEEINPHVFVPHTSREAKGIPECSNCHVPHGPMPGAGDVIHAPKPDVQWCYDTCHHRNTFEPCKNCHK